MTPPIRIAFSSALALGLFGLAPHVAFAEPLTSGPFTVQVTVEKGCVASFSGNDFKFRTLSGLSDDASNNTLSIDFTVKCTSGTPYSVTLISSNDGNRGGLGIERYMTLSGDPTRKILYYLRTGGVSGPAVGQNFITPGLFTGDGAEKVVTLSATLDPAGWRSVSFPAHPVPGVYSDTVTATVNF